MALFVDILLRDKFIHLHDIKWVLLLFSFYRWGTKSLCSFSKNDLAREWQGWNKKGFGHGAHTCHIATYSTVENAFNYWKENGSIYKMYDILVVS